MISHLYEDYKEKVPSMLDGMFSFVLLDQNTNTFLAARCAAWGAPGVHGASGKLRGGGGGEWARAPALSTNPLPSTWHLSPGQRHPPRTPPTAPPPLLSPPSDPIGITSLYIGWGRDGATWVSSEMKCLKDECVRFQQFPPGHYYSSKTGEFVRYYNPQFYLDFEVRVAVCVWLCVCVCVWRR